MDKKNKPGQFPGGMDEQHKRRKYAAANIRAGGPAGGRMGAKPKVNDAKGTLLRLMKYLKHVWVQMAVAIIMLLLSTVATLITPKISGELIDLLADQTGMSGAGMWASAFGVYFTTAALTDALIKKNNGSSEKTSAIGRLGESFLAAASSVVAASLTTGAAGYMLIGEFTAELRRILIMMGGLYLVAVAASLVQSLMLVDAAQITVKKLRTDLFNRIQMLPLRFFDSRPNGEIMSRLSNDVDNVSNMLSNTVTQLLSSVITLVVCIVMMVTLSWQLTLVAFITIPFSMLIMSAITKRTRKYFRRQQEALGDLNGIAEETITGARVVKVFCHEKQVIDEFETYNEELTRVGTRATIFSSVIGPMMNVLHNISFALMAGIGGYLVVSGSVRSVGMIQSFLQYSRQFSRPFNDIANQITAIQSALAGAERVFEIMDTEAEPDDAPDAVHMDDAKGHVVFENVSFGYTPERMILKNISFEAKPGQTIALVGPTGAGKTTVVNLLMRFYDINSGRIEIDGHDIADIERQNLRDSMGMVLQDVYLFAGTVRDNICYSNLDATEEEMIEAAKMANCHNFITRLPEGYNTQLTEAGSNISQGQRQLISIARAILSNPKVLILEEATSSVDTRTEMNIQSAMLHLMKGRTSFVIAHRLSTIRNADLILVIDGGEIIERGTHEELVAKGGFYANLLKSQFRAQV